MLKIAICDDEKSFCHILHDKIQKILEDFKEIFTLEIYTDIIALQKSDLNFDIIFLDIKMPIKSGIKFAQEIRKQGNESEIIFISSFSEFVFDAFSVEAMDFLCKPVDDIKLCMTLERVIKKKKLQDKKCLFIQTLHWCKSIKLSSIFYCEVINRTIYIHTIDEVISYYGKIQNLEQQLDCRFFRCHRSYLVNLDFIITYSDGLITLENSEQIPVSRLRQKDFMSIMLQYMKRKNDK